MNALDDAKSYMQRLGWSERDGRTVKLDGQGNVIGRQGDAVWNKDADQAISAIVGGIRAHVFNPEDTH